MPSEHQLSEVLTEFARTMVTDFPIQGILDHLVRRIVDVLPVTSAGVTLIGPSLDPHYVAASDLAALRYEELQSELSDGPCLAAHHSGEAISVPDLRFETRFPVFTYRAIEAGLVAAFSFPLRHGSESLGALDLYRDTPGTLDPAAMRAARTLADVAAAYLLNAQSRADLRDSSDRSRQSALHDALTGLPNRILLLERLDHAVARGGRSDRVTAVLFVDLDRFKAVNDEHGHAVGDELLVAVAERLTAVLRPGDTLARLSGDEFVVLCEDIEGLEETDVIASRVGAAIATAFALTAGQVQVTASVGIALSRPGEDLSERLIEEADTAMYQAKRKGGNHHQGLDRVDQRAAAQRASLEHDLGEATERDELQVVYQPIVAAVDGRLIGFEGLVRWAHPRRGTVMPAVLVPLAERTGLIAEIGQRVLGLACADRCRWSPLQMAVNVSAHQLMAPGYVATVAAALVASGTDPGSLTLEITESAFVQDSQRALVVLEELHEIGVDLALDDFGTGYSSLTYLKRFPIDIVKIDQTFVADLERDRASHAIVAAVIDLAHNLGKTVVAEGVETAAQLDALEPLGCDYIQGFYFSRPMAPSAVDAMLAGRDPSSNVYLPLPAAA